MSTRREQFNAKNQSPGSKSIVPATVRYKHDKKKGVIVGLSAVEKMVCALRKALTAWSNKSGGERYYIIGNKIQLIASPMTTSGKEGERQTYRASGRCRIAAAHAGDHITTKVIQFSITYRDIVDEIGLADIEYIDPTTIDELPKNTPVNTSAIS